MFSFINREKLTCFATGYQYARHIVRWKVNGVSRRRGSDRFNTTCTEASRHSFHRLGRLLHPVKAGHTICLEAFVTWTHRSSMEVFVKAITENLLTGERQVCATAFMTMVAVDADGRPVEVPPVYPETEEEKWLYDGAEERMNYRKKRSKDSKVLAEKFGTDFPWDSSNNNKER